MARDENEDPWLRAAPPTGPPDRWSRPATTTAPRLIFEKAQPAADTFYGMIAERRGRLQGAEPAEPPRLPTAAVRAHRPPMPSPASFSAPSGRLTEFVKTDPRAHRAAGHGPEVGMRGRGGPGAAAPAWPRQRTKPSARIGRPSGPVAERQAPLNLQGAGVSPTSARCGAFSERTSPTPILEPKIRASPSTRPWSTRSCARRAASTPW